MSDDDTYDIFNEIVPEKISRRSFRRSTIISDTDSECETKIECEHPDVFDDGTRTICTQCGQEITCESISYDKEWKTNMNDARKSQRCTQRKQECKDIMKDIEGLDIPSDIKIMANNIFTIISENGRIFRGDKRKGMIYACVSNAYDQFDEYKHTKNVMYLQNYFKLTRAVLSKAINEFSLLLHTSKSKNTINMNVKKSYVSPENYINSLVSNIGGDDNDIREVMQLYRLIESNKSRILDISRPQSFAAGLVFYYYIQKKRDTDVNKFVKDSNSGLSPLTVKKNMDEIDRILAKIIIK